MKRGHVNSVLMSVDVGDLVVYSADGSPGLITKIVKRVKTSTEESISIEILWSDQKAPAEAKIRTMDVRMGWVSFIIR